MSFMRGQPRPVDGDSTAGQLINLTARVDQAAAILTDALKQHKGNRALCDVLLDVRNALSPPRRQ